MNDPDPRPPAVTDENEAPAERVYFHLACGGYTYINGVDFDQLANPFVTVAGTYCAQCDDYPGLEQVYWEETKESIDAYRRRLLAETPFAQRLFYWSVTPLLAGLLGFAIGSMFLEWFLALIAVAPVVAFGAHYECREYVLRWLCRLDFRDRL